MADRIITMRHAMVKSLKDHGSPHDWTHITDQIGMFAFTGITADQVADLSNKHHIYLVKSGRISIAGLNTKNFDRIAGAFHEVTKNSSL
jgi:aspartate aminotransferase